MTEKERLEAKERELLDKWLATPSAESDAALRELEAVQLQLADEFAARFKEKCPR